MIFVVTDPHMGCTVKTDAELKSIVSVKEWKQIAKLAVGECISLRRDFGNRQLQISRTEMEKNLVRYVFVEKGKS